MADTIATVPVHASVTAWKALSKEILTQKAPLDKPVRKASTAPRMNPTSAEMPSTISWMNTMRSSKRILIAPNKAIKDEARTERRYLKALKTESPTK